MKFKNIKFGFSSLFVLLVLALLMFSTFVIAASRGSGEGGTSGPNQLSCRDSDSCREIDDIWASLLSSPGFTSLNGNKDLVWNPYDGESTIGEWVEYNDKYPEFEEEESVSTSVSGSCSYFNVGEPTGAVSCSDTLNAIVNDKGSSTRVDKYAQKFDQALSDNNIFGNLWVGKLTSNGGSDSVGLSETGRLTIVFAPCTTDLTKDYEVMYYFHGIHGFGYKDITDDTYDDFNKRMAPQLKKMSSAGRNFVLVFPELLWSAGDQGNYASRGAQSRSALWAGSDSNLVTLHNDVVSMLKSDFGANSNPSFVSMTGQSAGGSALSNAASNGALSSIGVDKITFSDADYGSQTKNVYNKYVKSNSDVELNMLVQAKIGGAHDPTRYSIDLVKEIGGSSTSSWTYEIQSGSKYNYLSSYSTPGAEIGEIFKVAEQNNNINYLPLSKTHDEIGKMSLSFVEGDYSLICSGSSSGVSGTNGNLDLSQLTKVQSNIYLEDQAAAKYNEMKSVAATAGITISLSDGYRECGSPGDYAKGKWTQWSAWEKYQTEGSPVAARPNPSTQSAWEAGGGTCTSNHGLGKAIDVSGNSARRWVKSNGCNYDWWWGEAINESWHFVFSETKPTSFTPDGCSK